MRLECEAHCALPEALRAMHLFEVLYGESRLAALGRPGIEFICEPLGNELDRANRSGEVFFVHWACPPRFQVPTLHGLVSARPNGLTTTIMFDVIYEREIGIIGAIFDRCLGRRFAKGAAMAFFQRLLRFVEQEAGLESLLDRLLHGGRSTGRA